MLGLSADWQLDIKVRTEVKGQRSKIKNVLPFSTKINENKNQSTESIETFFIKAEKSITFFHVMHLK